MIKIWGSYSPCPSLNGITLQSLTWLISAPPSFLWDVIVAISRCFYDNFQIAFKTTWKPKLLFICYLILNLRFWYPLMTLITCIKGELYTKLKALRSVRIRNWISSFTYNYLTDMYILPLIYQTLHAEHIMMNETGTVPTLLHNLVWELDNMQVNKYKINSTYLFWSS